MVGGKRRRSANVLDGKLWVVSDDLFVGHAFGQLTQNQLDRDASSFNYRLAEHDLGVNGDAFMSHASGLRQR
jgi:hypothetical protein